MHVGIEASPRIQKFRAVGSNQLVNQYAHGAFAYEVHAFDRTATRTRGLTNEGTECDLVTKVLARGEITEQISCKLDGETEWSNELKVRLV
ncbi:MAG: hypothetical protein EBR06_02240 [Acidimicrobiia bacterium]|nr:hypothetical protein [Acidimicrobiia bacterium]